MPTNQEYDICGTSSLFFAHHRTQQFTIPNFEIMQGLFTANAHTMLMTAVVDLLWTRLLSTEIDSNINEGNQFQDSSRNGSQRII